MSPDTPMVPTVSSGWDLALLLPAIIAPFEAHIAQHGMGPDIPAFRLDREDFARRVGDVSPDERLR